MILVHFVVGGTKMTIIDGLIRTESDGSLSFGNCSLPNKSKVSDFEHNGDLYKVKTHKLIMCNLLGSL